MKLNLKAFALSLGILMGLGVFLVTVLFLILNHEGYTLHKLYKLMPGYNICWFGALFGLFWGFVYGCIGGGLFACIYNTFAKEK